MQDQLPVSVFLGLRQYRRGQCESLVVVPTRGLGYRDADARYCESCLVTDGLRQFACALERSYTLGVGVAVRAGECRTQQELELELAAAISRIADVLDQRDCALQMPESLAVRGALLGLDS